MKKIGFVGLGNMGAGMVAGLCSAKFEVIGYDEDSSKYEAVKSLLFTAAASVEQTFVADVLLLCLPHPDVSRNVIEKLLVSTNSTIKAVIETSTITPEASLHFKELLQAKGITYVCAPMIGGKTHAETHTVPFLVECEPGNFEMYKALFATMGTARYMGAVPSATLAKLSFNLCRYANLATAVNVYKLLNSYGADKESVFKLLAEQSLDNFGQVWAEDMRDMMLHDTPYVPSRVPAKDLSLLTEIAASKQIDPILFEAIRGVYKSLEN